MAPTFKIWVPRATGGELIDMDSLISAIDLIRHRAHNDTGSVALFARELLEELGLPLPADPEKRKPVPAKRPEQAYAIVQEYLATPGGQRCRHSMETVGGAWSEVKAWELAMEATLMGRSDPFTPAPDAQGAKVRKDYREVYADGAVPADQYGADDFGPVFAARFDSECKIGEICLITVGDWIMKTPAGYACTSCAATEYAEADLIIARYERQTGEVCR